MKRHLTFLAVLLVFGAVSGVAGAQTLDAAKIASIDKAANDFVAIAKGAIENGKPPRENDPAAKPLLDTVFDTRAIEGDKRVPWSDLKLLEQWNVALIKVGVIYYVAGTGKHDLADLSQDQAAVTRATQNTVTFAPEYGRYLDAQIKIHSALISTALAQMAVTTPEQAKDEEFRKTLNNISDATAEVMTGVLGGMALDGMTDAWLLGRVVTLLEITPKAARFMAPDDRLKVKTVAAAVAERIKNPDVQSGLNAIARGFELLAR
jgi:hypothetical protein